jgi:hypothetical protein
MIKYGESENFFSLFADKKNYFIIGNIKGHTRIYTNKFSLWNTQSYIHEKLILNSYEPELIYKEMHRLGRIYLYKQKNYDSEYD